MHISSALKSLGITQCTIEGNPTTESEFKNTFKKVASIDINGNPTFTDDWGFTWTELQAEITRLQAEETANQYQVNRAVEYPPLADLADALYHQSKGDETKLTAYLAKCEAVKTKYPKPN